jgi:2-aminoethylphosphonate-pyruvate transaminase
MDSSKISRTLTLNLFQQWKALEETGQFRFTPPTHTLMAFRQAMDEIVAEGGVQGRANRYIQNHKALIEGMREMGFNEYLAPEKQGYIITSFHYPSHPNFDFIRFYELLSNKGQIIYPGKLSNADCFRIGNIGRIDESDIGLLHACIRESLKEMELDIRMPE